jgi:chromosome segregation ATPase
MKSLVIMEIKPMTENCAGCTYASRGKHFHTLTMKTLEQTFQELTALIADQSRDLAMAMAELASVAKERDRLNTELSDACRKINSLSIALDTERITARHAKAESGTARQSLRAAEQDVDETESANSDLRNANRRLVADLAAAMERLNHAESIIMQ